MLTVSMVPAAAATISTRFKATLTQPKGHATMLVP
jgi:hypothetical protein